MLRPSKEAWDGQVGLFLADKQLRRARKEGGGVEGQLVKLIGVLGQCRLV